MKKLNETIYNKLLLQLEEAKAQGLTKLAEGILGAVGDSPSQTDETYSYAELSDDIHKDLWKLATKVAYYNDLKSIDVEKVDATIVNFASKLLDELERALGTDSVVISPLEPKVPGEK